MSVEQAASKEKWRMENGECERNEPDIYFGVKYVSGLKGEGSEKCKVKVAKFPVPSSK